jgi:hypothetical protein
MLSPMDVKQVQVNIDVGRRWRGTPIDRSINSFLSMGYNVAIIQGNDRQLVVGKGRFPPDIVNDEELGLDLEGKIKIRQAV